MVHMHSFEPTFLGGLSVVGPAEAYKSSAIAKMACIFLVNSHHGHVENPILDANAVDFYGTTMLQCPSQNPVVERYGTLA